MRGPAPLREQSAMANHRACRFLTVGLIALAILGVSYGIGRYFARPRPKHLTVHVSGAPGSRVSGAFEVGGVPQDVPQEAELPAIFTHTGLGASFTVRRLSGPDLPIVAAADIDGVPLGTGTALGGVRVYVSDGHAEPWFHAVEAEPEWKETHEDTPPPDLIGTQPPEWTPVEWINSDRLRLADLRGKVVLARWFTGPHCDDCLATAPALREFHERYHDLGLAVIGMYFHADDTVEKVRKIVDGYGYRFPVAIDRGARTRRLWCLGRYDYHFTSVTFLLDRQGVIRHIHPGGQYVKGDPEYQTMESEIRWWLVHD